MAENDQILFVGNIDMGISLEIEKIPGRWEAQRATEAGYTTDGRASRQAVAAIGLGGRAAILGRVGDDDFGRRILSDLTARGVDTAGLSPVPGSPTGLVLLCRTPGDAAPHIISSPGANAQFGPDYVRQNSGLFAGRAMTVVVNQMPPETVLAAVQTARRQAPGGTVILDPSPIESLPAELLAQVDVVLPDEWDIAHLTGCGTPTMGHARLALSRLLEQGARAVVLKCEGGALIATANEFITLGECDISEAVDKNGDKDIFIAALCMALSQRQALYPAVVYARAAAMFSRAARGISARLPTQRQLQNYLKKNPLFKSRG